MEEGEAGETVKPANLRRFALFRSITTPYDVRYGSNRYQLSGQVTSETKSRPVVPGVALAFLIKESLSKST